MQQRQEVVPTPWLDASVKPKGLDPFSGSSVLGTPNFQLKSYKDSEFPAIKCYFCLGYKRPGRLTIPEKWVDDTHELFAVALQWQLDKWIMWLLS